MKTDKIIVPIGGHKVATKTVDKLIKENMNLRKTVDSLRDKNEKKDQQLRIYQDLILSFDDKLNSPLNIYEISLN